ncbi:MAG: cysteine hydrolase [Pseudomonadota bacterium]
MRRRSHLLVIDPQNDFCDLPARSLPGDGNGPALPVPGAHADMLRVARIIDVAGAALGAISITLDSHHRIDIAHPAFWQDGQGAAVKPFTPITADDVRGGRFAPRDPHDMARALAYVEALEAAGRYTLMVWPTHCEIGSWGHNVHAEVRRAYNGWEEANQRSVFKLLKGSNPWTEHYSAVEAEVPDPADPATARNDAFIARLADSDCVYITGEAGSHCVRATTEHLVAHWDPQRIAQLALVTDCMSPVAGFEEPFLQFLQAMAERGVRLVSAQEVAQELEGGAP